MVRNKLGLAVKGLDLANLLKHAYYEGALYCLNNPKADASVGFVEQYDPTELPAFIRLSSFVTTYSSIALAEQERKLKREYHFEKLEGLLRDTFTKLDRLAENPEPQKGERDYHKEVVENLSRVSEHIADLELMEKEANDRV